MTDIHEVGDDLRLSLSAMMDQHRLPPSFLDDTIIPAYLPIADGIKESIRQRLQDSNTDIEGSIQNAETLLVGVQGAQGSGKSTCAEMLKVILSVKYGLRVAVLSIDDFYLTREQRGLLAREVHPLLATRGVPGTHDVDLALDTIQTLSSLTAGESCAIPRFDKASDDRAPESDWDSATGPVDVVIFEGWCVGLEPQADQELTKEVNEFEGLRDADARWRRYVNTCLAHHYPRLFERIACLVVIKAPSFSCVYQWRSLQEEKLKASVTQMQAEVGGAKQDKAIRTMSEAELKDFISHFQRLTEHALETLPAKADWLLELSEDHKVRRLSSNTH